MERRKFLLSALTVPMLADGTGIPGSASADKGFVVKANESRFGEKTMIYGISPNDIKVSSKDTGGKLTVFEYTGNQKGGPPLHIHNNQDEIFFVLEGEYTFQSGDEKFFLKQGDTIFLPKQIQHTFAQITEKDKMIFMVLPSGKMENYFRILGGLSSPPSPAEGAEIFEDHDMKVTGPPLPY